MKIAILTSGILPVPAVKGGAVENLVDFYLEYNDQHHLHDITVYSVWHPDTAGLDQLQSDVNHYVYIKTTGTWAKLKKKCFLLTHRKGLYHYSIEFFLNEAIKQIKHRHYDLIILENRPLYALKVAKLVKAPIAIHLHNDFLNENTPHAKDIYKAASRIVSVSDYVTNRVKAIGTDNHKCITVYNGIDLNLFSPATVNGLDRNQFGLHPDDFVIIYSGRLNPEKGIYELIQAVKRIDNPRVKLLVVGSSFYGNTSCEDTFIQELRREASSLKQRITFTGYIPYPHMPRYLALADIAVIPSQWEEPFGLTCLEAMAMKLPVIATRKGGIPEVVTERSAILLPSGENFVEALSASILDLYEHPEKRLAMAQSSLDQASAFGKQQYAESFFKALYY